MVEPERVLCGDGREPDGRGYATECDPGREIRLEDHCHWVDPLRGRAGSSGSSGAGSSSAIGTLSTAASRDRSTTETSSASPRSTRDTVHGRTRASRSKVDWVISAASRAAFTSRPNSA